LGQENLISVTSAGTSRSPVVLHATVDPGKYSATQLVDAVEYSISQALKREGITGEEYTCELVPHSQKVRLRCQDPAMYFSIIPVIGNVSLANIVITQLNNASATHNFQTSQELVDVSAKTILPRLGFSIRFLVSNRYTMTSGYDPEAVLKLRPGEIDTTQEANQNMVCGTRTVNVSTATFLNLYITEFNDTPTNPTNLHLLTTEEQQALLGAMYPVARVFLDKTTTDYDLVSFNRRTFLNPLEVPSTLTLVWTTPDNVICDFHGMNNKIALKVEEEYFPDEV